MVFKKLGRRIKARLEEAKISRRQVSVAKKIIRGKSRAAALREREKQEIKIAVEKERIRAARRIKAFKDRPRFLGRFAIEPPTISRAPSVTRKGIKKKAKKSGKKIKRVARQQRVSRQTTPFEALMSTSDAANLVR